MEKLEEFNKLLKQAGERLVKDIANGQQIECDYVVSVDSTLEPPYVISIDAGYPPVLRISSEYIAQAMLLTDEKERKKFSKVLRRKLSLAVSKIPRQQRTLALVPLGESIALSENAKKFVRTVVPERIHFSIPESHIQITETHSITVREITSGISVTLNGDNQSKIRAQALTQLTALVRDSEIYHLANQPQPEPKPNRILVSDETETDTVKYEH